MLSKEHAIAQEKADAADLAFARGEIEKAEEIYAEAAEHEARALAAVQPKQRRTYGIIGVSVATLWYRAGRFAEAEAIARDLLEEHDLLPTARRELEEVLEAVPRTVSVASGGASITLTPPPKTSARPPARVIEQLRLIRRSAAHERSIEDEYLSARTIVSDIATRKFNVPGSDAENLVQEVFLSYLQSSTKIENTRAWLIAAACNASRHYWRSQNRAQEFVRQTSTGDMQEIEITRLTVQKTLSLLPERCRQALTLFYIEGYSMSEIAARLGTTNRYAEKLLHSCRRRARQINADMVRE